MRHALLSIGLAVTLVAARASGSATEPGDDADALERRHLLELAQSAEPIPLVEQGTADIVGTTATASHLTSYDVETGIEGSLPGADAAADASPDTFVPSQDVAAVTVGPVEYPQENFPSFTSIFQLLMRFNVGGVDFYYRCSAFAIGSFHLLTAATCVYNHDPNRDGDTSDRGFASEVWAWAAQSNSIAPFRLLPGDDQSVGLRTPWPDHPFGEAKVTRYWTYASWRDARDPLSNVAFIALNRRDGDHTSWMGRETNVQTSALNYAGYPLSDPLPPGNVFMIRGFDAGNVVAYTDTNIIVSAVDLPGMNGMPYWRFADGQRFVQGWSSNTINGAPAPLRLTSKYFNDINTIIAQDESEIPPVARPDLIEYLFDRDGSKNVNRAKPGPHVLAPRDTFKVTYNVLNAGFADSGPITVDFYLSTNNLISTGDRHIGQVTLFGLSPYTFTKQTTKLKVPRNVAPGTYYVGWIASTGFAEYNSGDNSGAIDIVGGNNESIIVSPYDVDVNLSYASGTLGTRFSVSNPKPATWNATFVAQNGLASLFSTLVPVNATAAQFPVDIPLAPSGNVGIFTTLVSSGKIVDVDWSTIDTAPPTTHTCAIEGTASYSDSTIRADLRLTMPMSALLTWKVWRITALGQDVLLSTPIFAAGSYPRSLTVAQAGSSGIVGLLATATSSAEGIVCSRLIRVNTGG